MKKLYLFFSILFLGYFCGAQIVMFSDTSNKWKITGYHDVPSTPYTKSSFYVGDTTIGSTQYQILQEDTYRRFLIRETGWGWGKVYARALDGLDSVDHLIYDYTLSKGDTLRTEYNGHPSVAVVMDKGVTNFVGYEYITWNMKFIVGGGYPGEYVVIQGIGTLTDPLYPLLSDEYVENVSAVSCFTHNNAQPLVAPSVPYDAITATMLKANFDNDSSCAYNSLSVGTIGNAPTQTVQLLPNPLNSNTKFVFNPAIQIGTLVITNSVGQTIINRAVHNEKEFLIGNQISNPGIYFYRVSDYRTGKDFSGEFIY